jgi:hypothetical protein
MAFRIEYASRRAEVWAWYWKSWRRTLWKTHLAVFLIALTAVFLSGGGTNHPIKSIISAAGVGSLLIASMVVYPQIMFKPKTRIILMGSDGIETSIGNISARRTWGEMRSVLEEDGSIVLTVKNGNAFIVPARAFPSADVRADFLAFAQHSIPSRAA